MNPTTACPTACRRHSDLNYKSEGMKNDGAPSLMERDLIEHTRESDKLLEDWNKLNTRIEMNRTRLALLKSSSELTEEEKKRRPGPGGSERFNIKY